MMPAETRTAPGPMVLLGAALLLLGAAGARAADVCDGISPVAGEPLTTVRVAAGLLRPLLALSPPGDTERLFIVEQDGTIRILKNGTLLPDPFLDINSLVRSPLDTGGGNEEGLLGMAFHPDYATNGWFFIYHTNLASNNEVARYSRSAADGDQADAASRQPVLTISHPGADNHNGGMMAFGPAPGDGQLYIATGDGGFGCDPLNRAQNGGELLGKILRLNVDALPYTIPAGNPFLATPTFLDEIWAYGLRNPYRFSFDRAVHDLYIGDVGQSTWEEVDFQPATSSGGENYGWKVFEGEKCPNPSCTPAPSCASINNHTPPVHQYANGLEGCAVTGGYVYRGCRLPDLHGAYFFADFCGALLFTLRMSGGVATALTPRTSQLGPPPPQTIDLVSSFGEDGRGEIYILDRGGEVFKVVPVLTSMEVSGGGATPFMTGTSWTWEDLEATSMHPLTSYRVYRQQDRGTGPFDCAFEGPSPVWPGGDPLAPAAPGEVFTYLVTARNAAGLETSPGTGSALSPRTLSTLPCP